MDHQTFRSTISADGKLIHGQELNHVTSGDQIILDIDSLKMIGGATHTTLLGTAQNFLPASYQLKLRDIKQRADGFCQLTYDVL